MFNGTYHLKFKILERVSGIEPPSLPWQGSIIATIRHPLIFIVKAADHSALLPMADRWAL